jgi:hypothetical protein
VRDDLHHSIPLNHPWRKAVRSACDASMGWEVTAALERAAWSNGGDWWTSGWGEEFRRVLSRQADMFGTDRLREELNQLERKCPSVSAKRALDCAFAEVMQGRAGPELQQRVVSGALYLCAEDGIENAVAKVATEHGRIQAGALRRHLSDALKQCDFRAPPAPRKAIPKPTVQEALGTPLDLKG